LARAAVASPNNSELPRNDQLRLAALLLNRSYLDSLQTATAEAFSTLPAFALDSSPIKDDTRARMNTWLFTARANLLSPVPGDVYTMTIPDSIDASLKADLFATPPNNLQPCCVILTPECDIAQRKTLHQSASAGSLNPDHLHRVVFGYLVSGTPAILKESAPSRFAIGPLWQDGSVVTLVFHYATLSSAYHSTIAANKRIFSLGRDLLFDLQSKAANHVNRLGNFII
jgi:hypothetical protein